MKTSSKITNGLSRMLTVALPLALILVGCGDSTNQRGTANTSIPKVSSTNPSNGNAGVVLNRNITATFNVAMDPSTINSKTFMVKQGTNSVAGKVSSSGKVSTFTPTNYFKINSKYTSTITTGAKDLDGKRLATAFEWSFTTGSSVAQGPEPVLLGTSGTFAILAKSGVTNVPTSIVTGNVGASPITGAAILLSCAEVTGTIYSVDATGPACKVTDATLLTSAVGDMELAYADAAGRISPNFSELGTGEIGGLTLIPGLYKWSTGVSISTDVTLSGGANDVFIFQIAGTLAQANGTHVNLTGGAQAKNVFWQVAGSVSMGTTTSFEGTILAGTEITMNTGSTMNGRLLAQTAVNLQSATVTLP